MLTRKDGNRVDPAVEQGGGFVGTDAPLPGGVGDVGGGGRAAGVRLDAGDLQHLFEVRGGGIAGGSDPRPCRAVDVAAPGRLREGPPVVDGGLAGFARILRTLGEVEEDVGLIRARTTLVRKLERGPEMTSRGLEVATRGGGFV